MRDINFFTPYIKQEEISNSRTVITGIAAILTIGIAGTLGFNSFQIMNLKSEIESVNASLNDAKFVEQYQYSQEVSLKKGLLSGYNTALISVSDGIVGRSMIQMDIINKLNSTVPNGVNLKSLSIQGGTVTMNVTSSSDKQAADFKYNLDKLPIIKESFIPSISSDFGSPEEFSFSITCVLEESYYEN